jgi:hypothetical protein
MLPQTILYIAFGKEVFFHEVLFSYLSLRLVAPDARWRVVVYTDSPEWFAPYEGLTVVPLSREVIREWSGVAGYVYRSKIFALRDCMDRFPGGGVVLLDGDTFFVDDPRKTLSLIDARTAIMNCPEPGRHRVNACNRAIRASAELWKDLVMPGVLESWRTWNSGVIGLHASHRPLLDQILYVNDVLFRRSLIRTMEQVAESIVLGHRCKLVALDRELVHYYPMIADYLPRLEAFMAENLGRPFDELLAAASRFHPAMVNDPKPHGMSKWHNSLAKRKQMARYIFRRIVRSGRWMKEIAVSRRLAMATLQHDLPERLPDVK